MWEKKVLVLIMEGQWALANEATYGFWVHMMVLGPDNSKGQSFFSYEQVHEGLFVVIDFLACINTLSLRPFFHEEWKEIMVNIQTLMCYWFPDCVVKRSEGKEVPKLLPKSKGIWIPDHVIYKFMHRLWTSHRVEIANVIKKSKTLASPPKKFDTLEKVYKNHWLQLCRTTFFAVQQSKEIEAKNTMFGPFFSHVMNINEQGKMQMDKLRKSTKRKTMSTTTLSSPSPMNACLLSFPEEPLRYVHQLPFPSMRRRLSC
jgi:hypothetical protein